jgi:hypothetical protein
MTIGSIQPFYPTGTATVAASTTPASIALAGGGETVLVTNATTALAFIRFGADASVVANNADMPVLPGSKLLLGINGLICYASILLATGTGEVYFSRGDGSVV